MKNLRTLALRELSIRLVNYYPILAKIAGSTSAGVLLSQAYFIENSSIGRVIFDGQSYWYHTSDQWENELGMSYDEARTARKKLVKLGVLFEVRRGLPRKLYYRVDCSKLVALINEFLAAEEAAKAKKAAQKPVNSNFGDCRIIDIGETRILDPGLPDTKIRDCPEQISGITKNLYPGFSSSLDEEKNDNEKNKKEMNKKARRAGAPSSENKAPLPESVCIYQETFQRFPGSKLNAAQEAAGQTVPDRELIESTVSDTATWREVCDFWKKNGYSAFSVTRMLEKYRRTVAGGIRADGAQTAGGRTRRRPENLFRSDEPETTTTTFRELAMFCGTRKYYEAAREKFLLENPDRAREVSEYEQSYEFKF